jgi:hypothetical protein
MNMSYNDRTSSSDQNKDLTQDKNKELEHNASNDATKIQDQVYDNLQRMSDRFVNDAQELKERHDLMSRDLTSSNSESRNDVKKQELDPNVEMNALNKFQENQRNQLSQTQQLEKEVIDQQAKAIIELKTRQSQESEGLVRQSNKGPEDNHSRNFDLESRHQQEINELAKNFESQFKALQQHRDTMSVQMRNDEARFQQELFAKPQGSNHEKALQDVLDRQKTSNEQLTQNTQDRLKSIDNDLRSQQQKEFLQYAQKVYDNKFSKTPELNSLWNKAKEGKENFNDARNNFWKLVNSDNSREAQTVREVLKSAGYELREGSQAPRLEMKAADAKSMQTTLEKLSGEKKEVMKRAIADLSVNKDKQNNLERTYLTLTIDHASSQSVEKNRSLDPSNLRFMSSWDNSVRGARFDERDKALNKEAYDKRLGLNKIADVRRTDELDS